MEPKATRKQQSLIDTLKNLKNRELRHVPGIDAVVGKKKAKRDRNALTRLEDKT